ncbi:MAG: hypothetical protein JXX28_03485 [Deltaproteobacteria bacterium]|nr:hypothetical protein [Deltaproteobacteria bacterium]
MDAVLPILCLLSGVALTVAALYLALHRGYRQLAVAGSYREVARRLQLTADTRGLSLHGRLAGRRIWIGRVMIGYGAESATQFRGVLDLLRPLGLGLYIHQRGRQGRWFHRSRSPEQESGDALLDREFHVHADEEVAVRALLTPEVKVRLRELTQRWPEVELTDSEVRVNLRSPEASAARLLALVDAMMGLASALEAARSSVPVPAGLAHAGPVMQALADRYDLAVEGWLPAVEGVFRERQVLVTVERQGDGYAAQLFLAFVAHRSTGLRLTPQRAPDGYWSVGQDIQVGHPRFDAAFVIKAWNPHLVRALLHDEVRAVLLELNQLGELEVDDRGLTLAGLPISEETLDKALHQAREACRRIGW